MGPLEFIEQKSPKGLSWNYVIAYQELCPSGNYYHKGNHLHPGHGQGTGGFGRKKSKHWPWTSCMWYLKSLLQMKVFPQSLEGPWQLHLNSSVGPGEEGGSSLLFPRTGVKVRSEIGGSERSFSGVFSAGTVCLSAMWVFNYSSDLMGESHWVHLKSLEMMMESFVIFGVTRQEEGGWAFFFRKASLRLAFLLNVEGLGLFSIGLTSLVFFLVSKEKMKEGPMLTEKVNSRPWLASVWQRSRHWVAREELSPATAAIFTFTSELWKWRKDCCACCCCCPES